MDTKGFGTFTMADQSAGSQPEELLDTLQQDQSGDSAAAPWSVRWTECPFSSST